jgi:uncharacterized membrane protein YeiB
MRKQDVRERQGRERQERQTQRTVVPEMQVRRLVFLAVFGVLHVVFDVLH